MHDSLVFTNRTFWDQFVRDLQRARYRVLIHSPFVSKRRLDFLNYKFLSLIDRGVTVCVFVQKPRKPAVQDRRGVKDEFTYVIESLQDMKIHVNLRSNIHEKLAVVDDAVLWEGSLNILSHANSKERMRRLTSYNEIQNAISQHELFGCESCLINYERYGCGSAKMLIERLTKIRKTQNISAVEVAEHCGISGSWIARIEKNKRNTSLKTFMDMADKLQVEPILVPKVFVPSILQLLSDAEKDSGNSSTYPINSHLL